MPTTVSDTGFYAVINFASPGKEITSIGHNVGATIYNPPGTAVIEPADLPLYGTDTPDPDAEYIRTPFEAFLQTLYGAGVSLTSSSVEHDLNADIEAAGLSDDYAKVQVADFMAFCGALKRYQTLKDGTQVDLLSLGPGDERPNLNDLQRSDDFTLMYGIIDHIGIQGILPYLYVKEGLTFDELCERIRAWKTIKEERETWTYEKLIPLLREQKAPVLTEQQVLMIVSE